MSMAAKKTDKWKHFVSILEENLFDVTLDTLVSTFEIGIIPLV